MLLHGILIALVQNLLVNAHIASAFVETPYLTYQINSSWALNKTTPQRNLLNQVEYPAIIALPAQPNSTYYYSAFKYVLSLLSPTISQFILYPFQFTLEGESYPQGAFIATKNQTLPLENSSNFFKYLANSSSITFGKAKALYDMNIAILKISQITEQGTIDLTYESAYYCSVLTDTLSKYGDCLTSETYAEFKNEASNTGKSYLMFATENEIKNNNFLYDADGLNFGMLIIPDYILGNDTDITSALTSKGISNIKKYIQNGGTVFSSGKSGYLLEKWGVFDSGTFNTNYLLFSSDTNSEVKYDTCADSNSFLLMTLCHNARKQGTPTIGGSYLLSSFFMNQAKASGYTTLFNLDETDLLLKKRDAETGDVITLTENDRLYLPFVVTKTLDKGTIYHMNGNPLFKGWYGSTFYNYMLLAMSKPVIFDSKIQTQNNLPIPAGEAGVNLAVTYSFYNLFDTALSNFTLNFVVPPLIDVINFPNSCTLDDPKLIICTQNSINSFSKYEGEIRIEITDQNVTQKMNDIALLTPSISYNDSNGAPASFKYDSITTDAKLAAVLRGTLNLDNHALPGHGLKSDIVLNVENKEDTEAVDVEFIAIIPLISPVVNMIDKKVGRTAVYYKSFYTNHNIEIPFNETGDSETIDFQELNDKDAILIPDFAMPVKQQLIERGGAEITDSEIVNIQSPNLYIPNLKVSLKQIGYMNPETFFDFAIPRLLIYLDTNRENGSKAIYPGGVPDDIKSKSNPSIEKKRYVFNRVDVAFYRAGEAVLPNGVNSSHFITIDRYHPENAPCVNGVRNYGSSAVINGSFGADGLVEAEYSNGLLALCSKTPLNFSKENELIDQSNSTIKPISYLYQVNDDEVTSPEDIIGFKENADGTGYYEQYPELQYVFAYTFTIEINPNDTRIGGKLIITLPANVAFKDANCDGVVTYAADHISFYHTDCTLSTITAYFKRGNMPNEAYGKTTVTTITIQNLNVSMFTFAVSIDLYEFKYDLSSIETSFEKYNFKRSLSADPERRAFFRLPAVEVHFKLKRSTSTSINGYELMDPFARYGIYIQELLKHRMVWTPTGTELPVDPGLVLMDAGFNTMANLGSSPTPFAEYLTIGSIVLPSYPSCSRIEWKDIWGRKWMEPMRTLFIEATPLPGPIRNFMMSSTYELLNSDGRRIMDWNSDKSAYVRVQIKLLNMYPKYFPLTVCKDIEVGYINTKSIMTDYIRIYSPPPYNFQITSTADTTYFANVGHRSYYGYCYDAPGTVMAGVTLSTETLTQIDNTYLCSESYNETFLKECEANNSNLPQLHIRPADNEDVLWNYSPKVNSYFPTNYIKSNMWDMTHYDYEDNFLTKGYKLHQDNGLPSVEVGPPRNPAVYKPHNIIAQPIFKGLGYSVVYNSSIKNKKFGNLSGWWSDNLQNKDHTLLAGQPTSNDISVDKQSLLNDSMWVNAKDVKGADNIVSGRLKNIYTCLFNRHKLRVNLSNPLYTYPANVYQNNIVPIFPDLESNDDRLSMYNCTGNQYGPENISQANNVVYTPTDRDWLYFAAALRANAFETINIMFAINPISTVQYEGHAKVNDGARFVYWNPSGSTSQFMIVDNPVNIIEAKRNDLSINANIYPTVTTTFSSVLYHIITIKDPNEENREWKDDTYINHYGFGDSSVSVYVGGIASSSAILNPGDSTYIKLTFYNNAGFDWNLKYDAITYSEFVYEEGKPFLKNYTIFVANPTSYKFLKLTIPDAIANYVTIEPSNVKEGVRSQFAGFDNFNVATIRDGFKGDYFYKLTLAGGFPSNLQGNVFEISIDIVSKYFDKLPGYNDPTASKFHDYTLKIPSIKFAVPYQSGSNQGKAFYTSGYSSNLKILLKIPGDFTVGELRQITNAQINSMSEATADLENVNSQLKTIWEGLPTVDYNRSEYLSWSTQFISFMLQNQVPFFPIKGFPNRDTTTISFAVKMTSPQLEYGARKASFDPRIYFNDYMNATKNNGISGASTKYVDAKGAWLSVRYSYVLMRLLTNGSFVEKNDTRLYPADGGYMKVVISAKNVGNKEAYNVNYTLFNDTGVKIIESMLPDTFPHTITATSTTLMTQMILPPGEQLRETIYIEFDPLPSTRQLSTSTNISRSFIKSVSASIDLNAVPGDVSVEQQISSTFLYTYATTGVRETVKLSVTIDKDNLVHLSATADPAESCLIFYRYNDTDGKWSDLQSCVLTSQITDGPFSNYSLEKEITYYKVESYESSTNKFLAEDFWKNDMLYIDDNGTKNNSNNTPAFVFPIWAMIVIVVGGAGLISGITVIVVKKCRKKIKVVETVSTYIIKAEEGKSSLTMS